MFSKTTKKGFFFLLSSNDVGGKKNKKIRLQKADTGNENRERRRKRSRLLRGLAVSGVVLHEVLRLLGGDHVDVTHLFNDT